MQTQRPSLLAERLNGIPPFHVMELLARAQQLQAQGKDVIHMEVGEPDFPTSEPVLAAARAFLDNGQVRYTPALGLPQLRAAISDFYRTQFQAAVPAERIVITAGASGALLLTVAALTNPGEEWLLTDPGYPCNRQFIQAFGGKVKALEVDASTAYQPSPAQIDAAWGPNTKAALVASPSNPTGTLIKPDVLNTLADIAAQHGGCLLVDEIYQGLVYGQAASTVLAMRDDVFVVNSFSKYFGMTGWRLGWLVVPEEFTRHVEKLAQHLYIAPSTPAQYAALAAFSAENLAILEARRQAFGERRNTLLTGLRALGFGIDSEPEGAFYIYANVAHLGGDSMALAHRLLEQAHVATTPGIDFGSHRAEQHLRIAYTTEVARIEEALARIKTAL
ncbi:pyridoxal phosphate-dependent aminotransferase [Uliginosibacterium gangwonense]|uniref:pyridoxal phosphate-dependent aminotransferase n=1 Tax=Uliginosibacterium gangwonense TaxID=392736 RepID=UPI00036D2C18|nr:pyridoxal phosphate-dependent aminotransferase [Uliginosibacterium gangwonense]